MEISVVLCTYNRSRSLARALESLSALVCPATTQWEVLVVDNNSRDDTRQVVERFCAAHPGRFRYLFEPKQGKSNALNAGIGHARGEILAFTDDDVKVEPNWLEDLVSALGNREYAGAAGRILPLRNIETPSWLAIDGPYNIIGSLAAYFDQGDNPHDLAIPAFGANMAFRRDMFDKYGTFRVDLGPSSKARVSSEDTEFCRRLLAGGERLRYVPTALVYHEILTERIRKENILTWWFGVGVGTVREARTNLTALQTFKVLGRIVVTAIEGAFSFDRKKRFYYRCRVWWGAGKLTEAVQRALRAGAA